MADLRSNADTLLATVDSIDLNALAETTLYTCPVGFICVITKVVLRNLSGALATASISFGWDTGDADDVIANGVRALTGATNYEIIGAKSDAVRGIAGGTFKIDVNTAEGGALTGSVDVFGYLVAV